MIYVLYKIRQEVLENIKIEKWFEVLCYAISVLIGIVAIWLSSSMSIENTIALLLGSAFALSFPNLHHIFKIKSRFTKQIYGNTTVETLIARIIGGLVGVAVVSFFVSPVSLWLTIPIAVGITFGEFINIKVKKMLDIEFWSDTIPGHGGFLDRFSTLSYAAIIVLIVQYF
jgi:phosphatidate cytidylyltransferase